MQVLDVLQDNIKIQCKYTQGAVHYKAESCILKENQLNPSCKPLLFFEKSRGSVTLKLYQWL